MNLDSTDTPVILDLIRNPEGRMGDIRHSRVGGKPQGGATQDKPTNRIPLSLDGDLCKTQWNGDNMS